MKYQVLTVHRWIVALLLMIAQQQLLAHQLDFDAHANHDVCGQCILLSDTGHSPPSRINHNLVQANLVYAPLNMMPCIERHSGFDFKAQPRAPPYSSFPKKNHG